MRLGIRLSSSTQIRLTVARSSTPPVPSCNLSFVQHLVGRKPSQNLSPTLEQPNGMHIHCPPSTERARPPPSRLGFLSPSSHRPRFRSVCKSKPRALFR